MHAANREEEARGLLRTALGLDAVALERQALTDSGNTVFRADLANGEAVAMRMSPRPATFRYTQRNLAALRELGLPVPTCRAEGATATGSFIVLDWLPGVDLAQALPALSARELAGIAATVHEVQRRVANLPQSRSYGWAPIGGNPAAGAWSEIFGPQATEPAADPLLSKLQATRRSLEGYFATVRPVCFLDDLTTKNLLIEHGAVSGIIDLDFVCYGDPLLSVGTTLAHLASLVNGDRYRAELLRCWNPQGDALRAVYFYASLWTLAALRGAESAGEPQRAAALQPVVETMLECAAGPKLEPATLPLSRRGWG